MRANTRTRDHASAGSRSHANALAHAHNLEGTIARALAPVLLFLHIYKTHAINRFFETLWTPDGDVMDAYTAAKGIKEVAEDAAAGALTSHIFVTCYLLQSHSSNNGFGGRVVRRRFAVVVAVPISLLMTMEIDMLLLLLFFHPSHQHTTQLAITDYYYSYYILHHYYHLLNLGPQYCS